MVRLDYLTCDIERLDTVRIDSSLCEPLCVLDFLSLCVEHLYEVTTDDLTLLLWVGNASEVREELLACINTYHVKTEALVILHYITELVLAKHSMINEDTCKAVADSLVEEYGCNA